MAYFLNLFSPTTYEVFSQTEMNISGFRLRHKNVAQNIAIGDKFICYMTKLSRWVGVLEVMSTAFEDNTPIYEENDPFVVRFKVKPLAWLAREAAISIHEDELWNSLSFTKDHNKNSSTWTGKIRSSLGQLKDMMVNYLRK
ncbi:EVE domain-containing protein [Trichocoleus sp. FACHB-262]|uniref:EVE domain-containing protein n=1 Tax=Trichocoleus sp. FACHB-262 TaxID=2692869 RepID=UPI001686096D|nr:EVE domain-containing protein [Trichocoleus sp. FACHB-262]MBD2124442.1 EVE domain-containing protein [Trichocoleus sp. FACHB-262]